VLCALSSRFSSPVGNNVIQISSVSNYDLPAALSAPPLVPKIEDTALSALKTHQTTTSLNAGARRRKGKQKADKGKIQITRISWQNCRDFSRPFNMACAPYPHGLFDRFIEHIASIETRQ
jgi:hypothetical protein